MFWNILNRFRQKIFSIKIFWLSHFFIILGPKITFLTFFNQKNFLNFLSFVQIMTVPEKLHGKKFDFEIFSLKYVLKHSESIPTIKNLSTKVFDFVIFLLFWPFLAENDRVRAKKFTRGKIFDFEIFGLKYVSKHSKSIPTKKKFSTKIFWLCHFFTIFGSRSRFWGFLDQNFCFQK